jgi:PAS domain S-box-containing protein
MVDRAKFEPRTRTPHPRNDVNFRQLFENAPIGMHQLDRAGKILNVNKAWLNLLGYQKNEVVGRLFTVLLPEAEKENAMARFLARLKGGKVPDRIGDRHYMKKDGSLFPVRTKDTIIKSQGKGGGVITSIEDLAPLRKIEAQQIKNKVLFSGVNVASNVIDGLSQRLLGIGGYSELVQMYLSKNPGKSGEYAQKIISEIGEINKIFNLVREYQELLSLLRNGEVQAKFIRRDILLDLMGARNRLVGEIQHGNSAIEITPNGDVPELNLHPKMTDSLYYILKSSLSSNDGQLPEDRYAKINVAADGDGLLMTISDNRRRVEAVTIERLEEPPFGHGITYLYKEYLELSLALLCIKLHGGTLKISSATAKDTTSGKEIVVETKFEIRLPYHI